MPHVPHVMPIEPGELLDFCAEAGYAARLERAGSWFTPPDYNVGMTDWERSLRLRCAPAAACDSWKRGGSPGCMHATPSRLRQCRSRRGGPACMLEVRVLGIRARAGPTCGAWGIASMA